MKSIWNEKVMLKSYEFLKRLQFSGADFALIGGWAVYLLTEYHMSRDIDLFVQEKELWKLASYVRSLGGKEKKSGLKKTGFVVGEIELDVYTEKQSDLALPVKKVFKEKLFVEVQGFKVLKPECLLVLKLAAAAGRKHSVKGFKDKCDVLALCFKSKVDFKEFRKLRGNASQLSELVKNADTEFDYVFQQGLIPSKKKKLKKQLLAKVTFPCR